MKSYSEVYNASRTEVHEQRKQLVEAQKVAIVNVLKENYNITGKVCECNEDTKNLMARRLMEFWSPKTGINQKGIDFLNDNRLMLTEKSTAADIKEYIRKMSVKNILECTEAFRQGCTNVLVENFNKDIAKMTGKQVKPQFIVDTVWKVVSDRIKKGI